MGIEPIALYRSINQIMLIRRPLLLDLEVVLRRPIEIAAVTGNHVEASTEMLGDPNTGLCGISFTR
jgi:hypothetical protein